MNNLSPYNNMVAFSWAFLIVLAVAIVRYVIDKGGE